MKDAIAIVGIGCRLPGAESAADFWHLLRQGVDATSTIPADRTDYRLKGSLGRIVQRGGFVSGFEEFDPYFFGLSPREAIGLDPQTRLLFEVAWRAAEDAGTTAPQLKQSRTGVFVGLCGDDYSRLIIERSPHMEFQATFGASRSSGSGRLSHALGLTGPSATIDTACSSSLVSVHMAVRAIQDGDCELAFAGGANVLVTPEHTVAFMRGGLLSSAGRCEAFREGANGFVRSEGAGMVLLKPLALALADDDRIYAVIRGSSVNNDGGDSLYMAPSVAGQVRVARAALKESGLSHLDVHYVETHGTGTRIGDPTEAEALATTFCEGRPEDRPLRLGSCKANIGHLEAGAGIAGLIKAALTIHHGELPPSIHAEPLNKGIPWAAWRLQVQQQLESWPSNGSPRVAAVNSFGITGTNAHLLLTDPPCAPRVESISSGLLRVLPVSARDEVSLKHMVGSWLQVLSAPDANLDDLCYTASTRRTPFDYRLAVVGRSPQQMYERLTSWAKEGSSDGVINDRVSPAARNPPVFVYSGIGSQWPRMALELHQNNAIFRSTFDRVADLFQQLSGIRLIEEIRLGAESSHIDRVQVMQPALFTLQIALTDILKSWGLEPTAVVGHSLGEAAAAHVAGALSIEDAVLYVHVRSECLTRTEDTGGMLALGITPDHARDVIRGLEDRLAIGVITAPDFVVLSGDRAALHIVEEKVRSSDVYCQFVKASVATHSPLMDPFLPEISARIAALRPRAEKIPFYSTVTGTRVDGETLTPDYWVRNVRDCVLFGPAMERMLQEHARSFIEVSAHPLLVRSMQETATRHSLAALIVPTLIRNRDSEETMLEAVSRLYAVGYALNWRAQCTPGARHVDVPGHPFRRERLWVNEVGPLAHAEQTFSRMTRPQAHVLLPMRWDSAEQPGTVAWRVTLDSREHPFLREHIVGGQATLPFTTYVELAIAAATEVFGPGPKTFRNMRLLKGQFFEASETITLQIVLARAGMDVHSISFYSLDSRGEWELVCDVAVPSGGPFAALDPGVDLRVAASRFPVPVSRDRLHEIQELHGFHYGPLYQGVREAWRGTDECLTRVEYLPELRGEAGFVVHPAFLDAALHGSFVGYEVAMLRLPVSVDEIHIAELPAADIFWGYGTTARGPGWERHDEWLLDDGGRPLIMFRGVLAKELDAPTTTTDQATASWMYDTAWERVDATQGATLPGRWLIVSNEAKVAAALRDGLAMIGNVCHVVRPGTEATAMLASHTDSSELPWRGIVFLLPSEGQIECSDKDFQRAACGGLLDLLSNCVHIDWKQAPRLFVVSRGAFRVSAGDRPSVSLAPALGLARVAGNEVPSHRVTVVDLDPAGASFDPLLSEIHTQWTGESEIAFRDGERYVRRLVRLDVGRLRRRTKRVKLDDGRAEAYRLVSPNPGVLDDLCLELAERRAPGADEVEIRVSAAGLNFLDVLRSLRMGPAQQSGAAAFGLECSGVITRVGDAVTTLRPGQRVLALAKGEGCFQSHLTISERFVFSLPPEIDSTAAATWLVAYQTAWYALNEMGRLRQGETVLIHAAAGGVGLAAVHVARYLGCEVYATAGSSEKQEYLRQLGVQHVMSSRTLDFADEIMTLTRGRGVDAVLNSIAGEAIPKSLSVLAMGGRFLEIGKRDIYANSKLDLLPFRRNLSYYAIDMLGLTEECEDRALSVTRQAVDLLISGHLPSLPYITFSSTDAQEAFRYMAQSKQIGKVVISFEATELDVEVPNDRLVRADRRYVITGGLSGIGLRCARWLTERGARRIILAARRAPDAAAQRLIDEMRESGAEVTVMSVDVSDPQQVRELVQQCRAADDAPLAGVVHAAGVLRDGVIANLAWNDFEAVFAPKVYGTANLLASLEGQDLDFLVLFSSVASTLASPGQGSYVAANSYLDAVGDALRGHPSVLRINWGPWTGLGMLDAAGLRPAPMFGEHGIRPEQGISAFEVLLSRRCTTAVVMPADWRIWQEAVPDLSNRPFFAHMANEMGGAPSAQSAQHVSHAIAALPRHEAVAYLTRILRDAVTRVLRIPDERMENSVGLLHLGLDSLTAVELGHRIQTDIGIPVSLMQLLRGPTLDELAAVIHARVTSATPAPEATSESVFSPLDVDSMPEAQVDELLSSYGATRGDLN